MRFNKTICWNLRCASSDARSHGWISTRQCFCPKCADSRIRKRGCRAAVRHNTCLRGSGRFRSLRREPACNIWRHKDQAGSLHSNSDPEQHYVAAGPHARGLGIGFRLQDADPVSVWVGAHRLSGDGHERGGRRRQGHGRRRVGRHLQRSDRSRRDYSVARWGEHTIVLAYHSAILYPPPDNSGESGLCVSGQSGCVRAQLSCLLSRKRCLG